MNASGLIREARKAAPREYQGQDISVPAGGHGAPCILGEPGCFTGTGQHRAATRVARSRV